MAPRCRSMAACLAALPVAGALGVQALRDREVVLGHSLVPVHPGAQGMMESVTQLDATMRKSGIRADGPLTGTPLMATQIMFVSSPTSQKVVYTELRDFKSTSGVTYPLVDSGLAEPCGLAVDRRRGDLYVADRGQKMIFRYTLLAHQAQDGSYQLQTDGTRVTVVENRSVEWIALDQNGTLFFTDSSKNSVNKVTKEVLDRLLVGDYTAEDLQVVPEIDLAASSRTNASGKATEVFTAKPRILSMYRGSNWLRQRLCLSTVSGRPVVITDIRPRDEEPGLRDFEASFVRLLDKLCDGSDININETGTTLRYSPGQIIGGDGLAHTCPPSRCVTYFLEGLLLLAPLAKQPLSIRLKGVTNGGPDVSCDTFRTATLPLLAKFGISEQLVFKIQKRGAPPLGGGEVVFSCPTLKGIQPLELLDEGKVKRVRGVAYTTKVSPQFAARMVDAARGELNDFLPDVWIYSDHCKGAACGESPGFGLSLVAETITRCLKSADASADLGGAGRVAPARHAGEGEGDLPDLSDPEAVGRQAARRLLAEIDLDGVVDTVHQGLVLYFLSLCDDLKPARVRLSKLSPSAAQMLRHIRDFLGVVFQIREDQGDRETVVLSCLGAGIRNTARRTF